MWNKRINKPLLWALALSALLHALFVVGHFPMPGEADEDTLSLRVALLPAAIAPPPVPLPAPPPPAVTQKPAPPLPSSPEAPAAPLPLPSAVAEEPAPAERTPEIAEPQPPVSPASPVEPAVQEAVVEDRVSLDEAAPSVAAEQSESPPYFVVLDFEILRKGRVIGTEQHVYDYGDTGYTLTSIAKPKGLYALALSELTQKSEGKVTSQGLRPERFTYQYGNNPDKVQRAFFDWNRGVLFLQTASKKQEVPLSEGAQDLMSFMYQFMYVPPLQQMQLAITNGKRFKVYEYAFEGEETVELPVGKVRTLHIARSSDDGEEKTELWLAPDYHYLPLKFRKTEKDGTVLERLATRVHME